MFQQRDEFFRVITVQTTLRSKIIYESATSFPGPPLMHSTFAALFDLLFIYFTHFKSEALSVNPAALDWNIFYTLQDISSSYFLNGLICFLGMFPEPDSFCLS